jgi:hypothetical protein
VEATRIVVSGVDLGVPGAGVTARAVTIEGLGLDATITDTGAVVDRLDIGTLSADQIVYDGREPDDSTVHAELRSGALTGIHVSGLEIGAGGLIKGSVDVAGVQDIRYRVALGTLTGGEHTWVQGTLKGTSKKGPVIHAETASAGGKTYSLTLNDLEALGTEVHTPDGSVVIRHVKIGGKVVHSDAGTTVSLHLSAIDLRALNWTAGRLNITSAGAITLDTVDVDASLDAAGLHIRELTVTKLTADQLHVVDKPLDITLGPAGTGGLSVARIHLTDFLLPRGPDGKLAGSPTAGHLDVTGLGIDFAGQLTASLKASGQISAKTITVDFQRGGRLVARAQGLGATVAVDAGGTQATVAFADVDTGLISVGPDGYTVHDLQVKEITLSGIHLETVAGGHKLKLDSNATGDVTIKSLAVKAHIDPALTKIELTHFKIARIEFQGLVLELPDDHVKVTVLKSEPRAFFRDIVLEGATTGEPFLITPGGPELLRGVARLEETSIPKLEAEVKGAFHGTVGLHTDTASIEFLEKGETKIDVKNPRAKLSDPATLGSTDETIKIEELGAESVHVEKGVTTIHHTTLKNLTYTRPGIEVTLQQASIPDDVKTTFTEGTIPELQISEAKFTVDFTKLPEKKPTDPKLYLGGLEGLLDGLQGQLWMTVYAQARILGADDDLEIPVHLQFTDGKINFGDLAAELQGKIRVHYARSGIDDDVIEWAVADPVFELDDSTLVFGVTNVGYRKDLVSWNLLYGDYKIAEGEKRVRLARLIDPVDTGEPSALDKDTLEFRDIVANLSVTTKKSVELTLGYGHIGGRIVFAPSALAGLTIRGDVNAPARPSGRARPASPGKLDVISFDSVKLQTVQLWLPGRDVRVGTGKPGALPGLEIKDMRDGSLTLKGHDPQVFKATITSAIARDIYWGPSSLRRPH